MAVFKSGSFTKITNTSGLPTSQTITHSLGVTPKFLILWWMRSAAAFGSIQTNGSMGFYDGTTEVSIELVTGIGIVAFRDDRILGRTTNQKASVSAWNSSTFTLNWTNNNTTTADQIVYIIGGGDDLQAQLVTWQETTTSADWSITGLPFAPKAFLNLGSPAAWNVNGGDIDLCIGMASLEKALNGTQTIRQGFNTQIYISDAYSTTYRSIASNSGFVGRSHTTTGAIVWRSRQSVLSFNSDGITIRPVTVPGSGVTGINNITLFLGGIDAHMLDSYRPSSGTNPSVTDTISDNTLSMKAAFCTASIGDNDVLANITSFVFGWKDSTNVFSIQNSETTNYQCNLRNDRIGTRWNTSGTTYGTHYGSFIPTLPTSGNTITNPFTGTPTSLGRVKMLLLGEALNVSSTQSIAFSEAAGVSLLKFGTDTFTLSPGAAVVGPIVTQLFGLTENKSIAITASRTDQATLSELRSILATMSRTDLFNIAQAASVSIFVAPTPKSGSDTFTFTEKSPRSITVKVLQTIAMIENKNIAAGLNASQTVTFIERPPNFPKIASDVATLISQAPNFSFNRSEAVSLTERPSSIQAQVTARNIIDLALEAASSTATIHSVDSLAVTSLAVLISPEQDHNPVLGELHMASALVGDLTIVEPLKGVIILSSPTIGTIIITSGGE